MTKGENKIIEIAIEIDRLLTDGIEIHTNSPIHEKLNQALHQPPVSGSLPSKDEAVNAGFRKATVEGYNYRRVCRDPNHDIYYSGWMDCYDWLSGNDC